MTLYDQIDKTVLLEAEKKWAKEGHATYASVLTSLCEALEKAGYVLVPFPGAHEAALKKSRPPIVMAPRKPTAEDFSDIC